MRLKQIALVLLLAACHKEAPTQQAPRSARVTPPGQLRATTPGSVDIYLDGKKLRSFQIADLKGDGVQLRGLVDGPVASVLVHGDSELTLQADRLGDMAIRLNHRGDLIKVGPRDGGGIRAVTWIEYHSAQSN